MTDQVEISNEDYWVKVVEMLQQNRALIEPTPAGRICVYFIGDTSGVFDEITFQSEDDAINALRRNGFSRYADDEKMQSFLHLPAAPFHRQLHPNGPIYSSGKYWVE